MSEDLRDLVDPHSKALQNPDRVTPPRSLPYCRGPESGQLKGFEHLADGVRETGGRRWHARSEARRVAASLERQSG